MSLAGENDDQDLLDWETVNALEYVRKSKIAEQQKLDSRVTAIGDWCVESGDKMFSKVNAMSKQVDKNANLLSSLQSASPERVDAVSHTISQRLSDLEYQMKNTQSKLNDIACKTENTLDDIKSMLQRLTSADVEQQTKRRESDVPTALC